MPLAYKQRRSSIPCRSKTSWRELLRYCIALHNIIRLRGKKLWFRIASVYTHISVKRLPSASIDNRLIYLYFLTHVSKNRTNDLKSKTNCKNFSSARESGRCLRQL